MGQSEKDKEDKEVLQQNREETEQDSGVAFIIHLLFEKKCGMPERDFMCRVMTDHVGEVDCFSYSPESAGFAAKKYSVHFEEENKDVPPMLMISGCFEREKPYFDAVAASQQWECPEYEEILDACPYEMCTVDMLAAMLPYRDRAQLLMDFTEALMEMFPECRAVIFESSKKMLTRETILNCDCPKENRFINFAMNVRFFNIQGTEDSVVDTIGMSSLFLPDLQYHFHDMDPNEVVNHAYNVLYYIFDHENPIKSGDHVDGVKDGQMSEEVQWYVRYEESLIQPVREVIDFNMGEFAAGKR